VQRCTYQACGFRGKNPLRRQMIDKVGRFSCKAVWLGDELGDLQALSTVSVPRGVFRHAQSPAMTRIRRHRSASIHSDGPPPSPPCRAYAVDADARRGPIAVLQHNGGLSNQRSEVWRSDLMGSVRSANRHMAVHAFDEAWRTAWIPSQSTWDVPGRGAFIIYVARRSTSQVCPMAGSTGARSNGTSATDACVTSAFLLWPGPRRCDRAESVECEGPCLWAATSFEPWP